MRIGELHSILLAAIISLVWCCWVEEDVVQVQTQSEKRMDHKNKYTYYIFKLLYLTSMMLLVRGHLLSNLCSSRRPSWPSRYMQQCRTFSITVSETITIRRSSDPLLNYGRDGTWLLAHLCSDQVITYELLQRPCLHTFIVSTFLAEICKVN